MDIYLLRSHFVNMYFFIFFSVRSEVYYKDSKWILIDRILGSVYIEYK